MFWSDGNMKTQKPLGGLVGWGICPILQGLCHSPASSLLMLYSALLPPSLTRSSATFFLLLTTPSLILALSLFQVLEGLGHATGHMSHIFVVLPSMHRMISSGASDAALGMWFDHLRCNELTCAAVCVHSNVMSTFHPTLCKSKYVGAHFVFISFVLLQSLDETT